MWLLIFVFFVMTLVVGWCFFGYVIVVCFMGLFRRKKIPQIPSELPAISVVIPCFNEENQIIAKLENTRNLDYPKASIEVVFADGGSTDNTFSLLSKTIKADEPYKVMRAPRPGKINQLNYVLPTLKGKIIVNTDVDSQLSADALKWIAAEFDVGEEVLVVGAYCRPSNSIEIEKYYWLVHNKTRFLESEANSSSIVIAQCYAFRKKLLNAFPEDVVADDVYIAFLAHRLGGRVVYSRYAKAVETRAPQGYADFLPHKFRKGNAFLRESLRFLYLLPEMDNFRKMMFLTRIAQQVLLPWTLVFWCLIIGILITTSRYDIVAFGFILILLLFILTGRIFTWIKLPDDNRRYSLITIAKVHFLTLGIMLATGISYPFFRQESNYRRLKDN